MVKNFIWVAGFLILLGVITNSLLNKTVEIETVISGEKRQEPPDEKEEVQVENMMKITKKLSPLYRELKKYEVSQITVSYNEKTISIDTPIKGSNKKLAKQIKEKVTEILTAKELDSFKIEILNASNEAIH